MGSSRRVVALLFVLLAAGVTSGQTTDDAVIDQIRDRSDISSTDKDRIEKWLEGKVDTLANADDPNAALQKLHTNFEDARNSPEFNTQLAITLSTVAKNRFAETSIDMSTAFVLSRQLAYLRRIETLAALQAGLKSPNPIVRYYMARGMTDIRDKIALDENAVQSTLAALREAAKTEGDPVVLGHFYRAMQFPGKVPEVLAAYLDIFDQRLAARRASGQVNDGSEIEAYEFFRDQAVLGQLNQTQQIELVKRLAVFFRLDAERYNDPQLEPPVGKVNLKFSEQDSLERSLIAVEHILTLLVNGQGRKVESELQSGGWSRRQAVLTSVYAWVGDKGTNQQGVLNAAPWNVPLGSP
jgi:hypothetical protein